MRAEFNRLQFLARDPSWKYGDTKKRCRTVPWGRIDCWLREGRRVQRCGTVWESSILSGRTELTRDAYGKEWATFAVLTRGIAECFEERRRACWTFKGSGSSIWHNCRKRGSLCHSPTFENKNGRFQGLNWGQGYHPSQVQLFPRLWRWRVHPSFKFLVLLGLQPIRNFSICWEGLIVTLQYSLLLLSNQVPQPQGSKAGHQRKCA